MELELSNFGKELLAGSSPKVAALSEITLKNPTYDLFKIPFDKNPKKRDILVSDPLMNEKNFISYWKSREKHRDPDHLAFPIKMGKIADVDGDGKEEFVAYFNDGTNENVLGYNQYALTAPFASQKKAKSNYYRQSAKDRAKQSYADFLEANADSMLKGWTDDKAIEKYKEGIEKKLITKVKKFFSTHGGSVYSTLTAKQKTALANTFIAIVAEAMIDNDANRAQAAEVKKLKGFIETKKNIVETLFTDSEIQKRGPKILSLILSGNAAVVEDYIDDYTEAAGSILSASDVTKLYTAASQARYVHGLGREDYNATAHGTGYNKWVSDRYGSINPLTAAVTLE